MDFNNFDTVKAEKANAMLKYNNLQTLTKVFRLLEFCLALILFSWIFNKLPFAVKISGEFLRHLAGIIASPLFVFLLSNGIIATLIAKSGRFSGENHGADNADTQLYEELVKNTDSNRNCPKPFLSENPDLLLSHAATATATEMETPTKEEEVVFQEKHIVISEENTSTRTRENGDEDHAPDAEIYSDLDSDCEKRKFRVGLTELDLRTVVMNFPEVLCRDVNKILKPNFAYLRRCGFNDRQVAALVTGYPPILIKSVKNSLEPRIKFLVEVMGRQIDEVVDYPNFFQHGLKKTLESRHKLLKQRKLDCSLSDMLGCNQKKFLMKYALLQGSA